MKTLSLFRLGIGLSSLLPTMLMAARPLNDRFESATVLYGRYDQRSNQDGSGATADALDPYVGLPAAKPGKTLWYRFDAPITTTHATLRLQDQTATGARAGVYQLRDPDGGAGSLMSLAQAAFDGGGDEDSLTFSIIRNTRYYILIDAPGVVALTLKIAGAANDFFDDAQVLSGNEGTITGANTNASSDWDWPVVESPNAPYAGVWYQWTPSVSGPVVIDTTFSELSMGMAHDTVLNVFTGSSLENLQLVTSNDDDPEPGRQHFYKNSRVTLNAVAGTIYHVWVGTSYASPVVTGPFYLSYYPATSAGVFVLDAPLTVGENQGDTAVAVRRFHAGTAAGVGVQISTSDDTAHAGSDYIGFNTARAFASGQILDTVSFRPLPDGLLEDSTERLRVALSGATGGAIVGSPNTLWVTIRDEQGSSSVSFANNNVEVHEEEGVVVLTLVRTAGLHSAMAVRVGSGTSVDTAQSGIDFALPSSPIYFAPGQSTATLRVGIYNDGRYTGQRSFRVFAAEDSAPGDAAVESAIVTILDDDLATAVPGRLSAIVDWGAIAAGVDLQITSLGAVSGKVRMARGTFSIAGKLDASGQLKVRFGASGGPNRTLQIRLLYPDNGIYRLTLNDEEFGSTAAISAYASTYSLRNPCPYAARFTCVAGAAGGIPQLAAGRIRVDSLGSVSFAGKLFDGTAFVAMGGMSPYGEANVAASLYGGRGRVTLWTWLRTAPGTATTGTFRLLRPGRANQSVELPSLDVDAPSTASRYVPPRSGEKVLSDWNSGNGFADIEGGGYSWPVTRTLIIGPKNQITVATEPTENLKLVVNPATGLVSGSLVPPGATGSKRVYGVLIQVPGGYSRAHFLNGIQAGSIRLRGP
jgi:hypothetical protein